MKIQNSHCIRWLALAVLLAAVSAPAQKTRARKPEGAAQPKALQAATQPTAAAAQAKEKEENKADPRIKGMKWRLVGPFRGGRVLAVAGVPSDPNLYYFGGVAGGVWKSTNAGMTWTPIFDKENVASIGAIAVAESDPNVIYVGTGEACLRGNIKQGDGVYKSTDAGKTWKNVGLTDTQAIGHIIVDPKNADVVFVAALGHPYGPNVERGVFRSTDGGKNWQKVLFRDENTGAIDITFDPSNSRILYASLWQVYRKPWELSSGGPGSGLYKSTDGGDTWKKIEGNGFPKAMLGRIGVTVSPANPNRVWALIEAGDNQAGLYRSDDGGEHWQMLTGDHRFTQRAWYYMHVFADPKNADTVYILNTGMYRSNDGGKTFTPLPAPHGDHHGLWINPNDPNRMINSNDGGANVSADGGRSWTTQMNQPTAQFYHVIADNRFPYYIYGAQQDNTTVGIASRGTGAGIDRPDWNPVGGCESGYVAPDPRNPDIVYAGCYGGTITRFNKANNQEQEINVWPDNPMGWGAAQLKDRFQWTAPIVISPNDPNTVYIGGERLFKTTDGGMSWTAISPDLTRNDKSKQQASGGPITKDNTSVEYYDTIFTIAESPKQAGVIWTGSDDGLVQITRDGGANWTNVTPRDLQEWSRISLIEASPHDAGTAYVAVDRHELDDFAPYIYKTADYGKSWTRINNGIPARDFVHAVREDPRRRGLLYAGTEHGVYYSLDDGANWQSLKLNLPDAPVHDLVVKNDDLAIATHGRAFWILDDLSPIQQTKPEIAASDAYLYQPRLAYRIRGAGFQIRPGTPVGQNPPAGAIVYYWLKDKPKDEITLEVMDSAGKLVRKYSSNEKKPEAGEGEEEFPGERGRPNPNLLPTDAGLNRFVWDLHYEDAARVPNSPLWAGSVRGPVVVPGTYQLRLTVAGKQYTAPVEVKLDPRVQTTPQDLQKQLDLALKIHGRLDQADATVNQIRDLRRQIDDLDKRLADDAKAKPVAEAAKKLKDKMTSVEENIVQTKSKASEDALNFPIKVNNKLAALESVVESADTAPTQQSYAVFDELSKELDQYMAQWNQILQNDLPQFNQLVHDQNVPALVMKAEKKT